MRFAQITGLTTMATALILGSGNFSRAQTGVDPDRLAGLREKLAQVEEVLDTLPDSAKERLSSGAQNLLKLAQGWEDVEGTLVQLPRNPGNEKNALRNDLRVSAASDAVDDPAASFSISNASADFVFSLMAGFTQSETSTAWCGNNIVTGFNDSGSILESLLFGPGGVSGSGASISSNKGLTFHDVGYINPGTDFTNFLAGDPVVTCALLPQTLNGRNFAIRDFEARDGMYHFADILVSRSITGGATWSAPILVSPPQAPHFVGLNLLGTDHYQPGIAVDRTGAIAVCWYDRRGDPANFKFGRACSISTNGVTWTQNFFINGNWSPVHATDVFINPAYFGDYDTVASDFLLSNSGFLGAFGLVSPNALVPNQDVAIFSVP